MNKFEKSEYALRAYNFVHNKVLPGRKRLSSLMLYTTDLCDSGCKHCLIWAKRPPVFLSLQDIKKIMQSKCIRKYTSVGLEGGEFLLHPEAEAIMDWFAKNHPKYDIFSNCLKPQRLIEAVKKYKPERLYISLDGDEETYQYMRGKNGYSGVIQVIEALKDIVPVFVMFTLSPYNDFNDLEHVTAICKAHNVFLRVGIYNNISFFDTIEQAGSFEFGQLKNKEMLNFKKVKQLQQEKINTKTEARVTEKAEDYDKYVANIPLSLPAFDENYDYVRLYPEWLKGDLRLKCNSIMDSLIILPDGKVPICQKLDLALGNIHIDNLDTIFNSANSVKQQQFHTANCNQCWVAYHRKYDIALYKNFEKYFGKYATSKLLGYYKWEADDSKPLRKSSR